MAANDETFAKLNQYLSELVRHTDGRYALHLRVSRMEKHYLESHYRRTIAALLRPLVEKHGAVIHPLPNADIILITKTATPQDIGAALTNIYKEFQKSVALAGLSAKAGVNDRFTTWYNLEEDYQTLIRDVELLETTGVSGSQATAGARAAGPVKKVKAPSAIRYVEIDAPRKDQSDRTFDPELLFAFTKALQSADVASFIKKKPVMAMIPNQGSAPVMVHRTVPLDDLFDHLLRETNLLPNAWLNGYVNDLVTDRILKSEPNMAEDRSLASSISLTVSAIMSEAFDDFDRAQENLKRSKIIIEFSVHDLFANPLTFMDAKGKIKALGYRYCISDIDLVSFSWSNKELLDADFVKVSYPPVLPEGWLDMKRSLILRTRLKDIGIAKFIMADCRTAVAIDTGQGLGFTMFQGDAVPSG